MPFVRLFLLILIFSRTLFSQQIKIEGNFYNRSNGQRLAFANLRAEGTSRGTSSDIHGRYQINLPQGRYTLIASSIGFKSDTLIIDLIEDKKNIDFFLNPVSIHLPEVTILPGKNPAIEIMEKAIKRKAEREKLIDSYEYDAYTKGVIRSNTEMGAESNQNSLSVAVKAAKDSLGLRINAIVENQSKGFYRKPGDYKELIVARKQTSNIPSSLNAVTGGRLIQNFYSDDLKFFNRPMAGPLSDNALKYYYFRIEDTSAIDSRKVFKIYFEPDNSTDPGFQGYVYITDSSFDMIRIDADLNRAANTGGIFDRVNIFQQFLPYANQIYMPIDYRLYIRANILGLAKVGFELNSVLYNYRINEPLGDSLFSKSILTVLPDADKKGPSYWKSIQTIPNSLEEIKAYKQIDSIQAQPRSIWSRVKEEALGRHMSISENVSTSGLLGLFHFNRVEGWALDFDLAAENLFDRRLFSDGKISYGFADKKAKQFFSASYYLGKYRTYSLSVNFFNRINSLFASSDAYNEFTSTILALLAKYDFRDYYYSNGFNFQMEGEVLPILKLNAGFTDRTDNSAFKHSDYSFFAKSRHYRDNPPIYETKINEINFGFNLDFRNFIEDGYFRRRVSEGKAYILLGGGVNISSKKAIGSLLDYVMYNADIQGTLGTFRAASLNYRLHSVYSDGPVPFQMQYALAGNISATGKNYTFRTVGISEVFADKVIAINIEHNFRDELFRLSRIPILKDMELQLNTFFDAAWTNMSAKSKEIIPIRYITMNKPLLEAGFNIGHVLFPFSLELAWRLTHRENNAFVIGINTFIL
ncbi:MAG: DUF5686 family protein [Bacteroidota bacterium]|nr:DUF5686 family protein [Bacteroidota bacterium]MDP4195641.1 DUF5686 family protein [Bacteroidota bacterium]